MTGRFPLSDRPRVDLCPFTEAHFPELAGQIATPQDLMQWAGRKYDFPLDYQQMAALMNQKDCRGLTIHRLYSAELPETGQIIGHIQLSILDRDAGLGNVGSVMIYRNFRGQGLSVSLMQSLIHSCVRDGLLQELRLAVFSFNSAAQACYARCGFREIPGSREARPVAGETWTVLKMSRKIPAFQASPHSSIYPI